MKRAALVAILLPLVCALFVIILLRIQLAREGEYGWEALRNYIIRDGQISVILTPGSVINTAKCNKSTDVTWASNCAIVKADYTWATDITVDYTTPQKENKQITISTEKINWTRLSFVEVSPGRFTMFENGVPKKLRYSIQQ